MKDNRGISSFSVLLMTAVAVIAGLASISLLKIQFSPSAPTRSITVSFSMPGASAQAVENEATAGGSPEPDFLRQGDLFCLVGGKGPGNRLLRPEMRHRPGTAGSGDGGPEHL